MLGCRCEIGSRFGMVKPRETELKKET